MTDTPGWLREVKAAARRGEQGRARAADERARWIAKGVAEHGMRGRQKAAEMLGISLSAVDQALARARGLDRPSTLPAPEELLGRVYALELAELPPLPDVYWQVLRYVVRSTALDVVWIGQPGELLAQEVEDIDPGEMPTGVEQAVLAETCRGWSRIQALAVLDALAHGTLPRAETC